VAPTQTLNYQESYRPANTAIAPAVVPTANCAMGNSVGIQGGVGFSMGHSYVDDNCATIEQAKALAILGDSQAAMEVMCELPKVRAARKRGVSPCWADRPENQKQAKADEPTDPYVRRRLGLPSME
jgi:hypothetical protein